jgi:hypothetical protein
MFTIYPLTLFWVVQISKNAKFLLTLTNRKGHLEMIQVALFCGLKCFLNTSINNKPIFFSEVVTFGNQSLLRGVWRVSTKVFLGTSRHKGNYGTIYILWFFGKPPPFQRTQKRGPVSPRFLSVYNFLNVYVMAIYAP